MQLLETKQFRSLQHLSIGINTRQLYHNDVGAMRP